MDGRDEDQRSIACCDGEARPNRADADMPRLAIIYQAPDENAPDETIRTNSDEARAILLDFLSDLYSNQADTIKADGSLRKGVSVPWSDSSEIAAPIKRQMLDLIKQTEPRLLYQSGTRPWRLNVEEYPTVESAIEALDTSVLRDV